MSWLCKSCGLSNSKASSKCIACFNHNPDKFWRCSCDYLNKVDTAKCTACYTIERPTISTTNDNHWEKSFASIPNNALSRYGSSKTFVWNGKLYTIMIDTTHRDVDYINISMTECIIPNVNKNRLPRLYGRQEESCWVCTYNSCSINHQNNELYFIIGVTNYCQRHTLLYVFDLKTQTLTNRIKLNLFKQIHEEIKQLLIINNNNIKSKTNDASAYNIINHWLRTNSMHISVPNEVYVLINRFYSFCSESNTLQLVIFATPFPRPRPPRYREHRNKQPPAIQNKLYHTMVNLNEVNASNEQWITVKEIDDTVIYSAIGRNSFLYIFSIRVGYELYMIFSKGTWVFNIENGGIYQLQKSLLPWDVSKISLNSPYYKGFDSLSCIDSNERYLFFLLQNLENPESTRRSQWQSHCIDLWCFDRENKVFFKLENTTQKCGYFTNVFTLRDSSVDIVRKGNELIIAELHGADIILFKTKLIMS